MKEGGGAYYRARPRRSGPARAQTMREKREQTAKELVGCEDGRRYERVRTCYCDEVQHSYRKKTMVEKYTTGVRDRSYIPSR